MTVKGGTSQACAACKYQRRKCSAECPLAPYFPADQPKMFQNAHRLFGVNNILKILKHLNPSQKMEAMRSIIYQSNIREKHRVHGCVGIILTLQYQIHQTELELEAVTAQLSMYRQQQSQQQLGDDGEITLPLFQQHLNGISLPPNHQSSCFNSHSALCSSKENIINSAAAAAWTIQPYNDNTAMTQLSSTAPVIQAVPIQQQRDYDEMSIFFDTIDDQGIILTLQYQIHQTELELEAVTAQLSMYRQQQSQQQLGDDGEITLPLFQQHLNGISLPPNHQSSCFNSHSALCSSKENIINSAAAAAWTIQQYNDNTAMTQLSSTAPVIQAVPIQQQRDYDEMSIFFDTIDDQQS